MNTYPSSVIIYYDDDGELREIFKCPQRDLFAKYRWPAEDGIKKAVMKVVG